MSENAEYFVFDECDCVNIYFGNTEYMISELSLISYDEKCKNQFLIKMCGMVTFSNKCFKDKTYPIFMDMCYSSTEELRGTTHGGRVRVLDDWAH